MTTLRNKQNLAALNKDNFEEHLGSNLAQISNAPRSHEDYVTQVSEEIEGKVTRKLSKVFKRTEGRIIGALSRLDEFLLNPLIQGHSGTSPETTSNTLATNEGTNEDDTQSDPHPEASVSQRQTTRNSGPDDAYDSLILESLICQWYLFRLRYFWSSILNKSAEQKTQS